MKQIVQVFLFITIIIAAGFNFITSPIALLLGFFLTLFLGNPFPDQTKKAISYLLKISVIGLGFGMSLTETIKTSKDGFILTALSISITIILGLLLIKLLKLDKKLGFLMTSGTAICGGSAIAAIAPVIKANGKTISMAIGVVFLLNSIALFIFPSIGHFFAMTQEQFGLWAAVAIHDTSSVVGAALEYGDRALQIATTVKLARTLWIIPLSIFAMLIFKSKGQKIKFPLFILGFIAAMLLNSYGFIPEVASFHIVDISKRLLVITLFLVGTTLTIKDLKASGFKPIFFSTVLWIFISIFSLIYVLNF